MDPPSVAVALLGDARGSLEGQGESLCGQSEGEGGSGARDELEGQVGRIELGLFQLGIGFCLFKWLLRTCYA